MPDTTKALDRPAPATEGPSRRNNVLALRYLLTFLVLLGHSCDLLHGITDKNLPITIWSRLAVNCFFILSGFLISQSWAHNPRLVPFFTKRILRIYPAFILSGLFCTFVVGPLASVTGHYRSDLSNQVGPYLWNLATLTKILTPPVFPANPVPGVINGSLWTIPWEMWCYGLVAALGITTLSRNRFVLLALFAVSYVLLIGQADGEIELPEGNWYNVLFIDRWPRLLSAYLAGACLYAFRDIIKVPTALAVCCLLTAPLWPSINPANEYNIQFALLLPALAILVYWYAFTPRLDHSRFLNGADYSYGMYVFAFPVQQLIVMFAKPHLNTFRMLLASLVFTACLAVPSWHFIEKPLIDLKKRRGNGKGANRVRVEDGHEAVGVNDISPSKYAALDHGVGVAAACATLLNRPLRASKALHSTSPHAKRQWAALTSVMLLVLTTHVSARPPHRTIRIMCIGDSLTYGATEDIRESRYGGYRQELAELLEKSGNDVTFVGSQRHSMTNPTQDNEGHGSWTALQLACRAAKYTRQANPDIVLCLAGINDILPSAHSSPSGGLLHVKLLVSEIHKTSPNAVVLVAKLLPLATYCKNARKEDVAAFNAGLPGVVRSFRCKKIQVVDPGGQARLSDRVYGKRGLHPTDQGYKQLGRAWYNVLLRSHALHN